jgi:hypothetical protein
VTVFIFSVVFFVSSVLAAVWSYRGLERLKQYEFENRTAAGVVQFQSYEQSKAHGRSKDFYQSIHNKAMTVVGFGILIILIMTGMHIFID